jgi:hypothetical protein
VTGAAGQRRLTTWRRSEVLIWRQERWDALVEFARGLAGAEVVEKEDAR